MVPFGLPWYHLVFHGTIWFTMVPFGLPWYRMALTWHHWGQWCPLSNGCVFSWMQCDQLFWCNELGWLGYEVSSYNVALYGIRGIIIQCGALWDMRYHHIMWSCMRYEVSSYNVELYGIWGIIIQCGAVWDTRYHHIMWTCMGYEVSSYNVKLYGIRGIII